MPRRQLFAPPLALALFFLVGCAARVGVGFRSYDPYYGDYHVWSDAEVPHYNAWIAETHRPNLDYGHIKPRDREEYWRWRHEHN